jgi:osmotically-inducible protein OsmY
MTEFIAPGAVRRLLVIAGLLGFAGFAQGCVPVVVGAGAAVAVTAAQNRPVKEAAGDQNLDLSIRRGLYKKDKDLGSRVGVSVIEGHVVLTGAVPKWEDRVAAAKVAWGFKNVKDVQNEIQVGDVGGPGRYAKDAWISTRVRAAIINDDKAKDVNYKVETVNGVVYLIGIARSREELDSVTDKARRVSGVKKVVSLVRVKTPERKTAER